jgi:predicted transcriptional regulator
VLHFEQMGNTLTMRLSEDLAKWLDETAKKSGVSRSQAVRSELERARASEGQRFMRLAGAIDGPPDLSQRKGLARK